MLLNSYDFGPDITNFCFKYCTYFFFLYNDLISLLQYDGDEVEVFKYQHFQSVTEQNLVQITDTSSVVVLRRKISSPRGDRYEPLNPLSFSVYFKTVSVTLDCFQRNWIQSFVVYEVVSNIKMENSFKIKSCQSRKKTDFRVVYSLSSQFFYIVSSSILPVYLYNGNFTLVFTPLRKTVSVVRNYQTCLVPFSFPFSGSFLCQ